MIEENKPFEEATAPTPDESLEGESLEGENPIGENSEPIAVTAQVLDEVLDADSIDPPIETAVSSEEEATDFEAAFLELRSSYAAKEQENAILKTQSDDRQNQYLRLAADFENYRRRTQKEKDELEVQIKCSTLSELLSVMDNFERARSQLKPANDGEMNIHKSYQSVYKELVDRFKKLGVTPMRPEGQPFDPSLHDAIMREPTKDFADGTVMEELVRGYMLGEKVLRHAMVKVATPPEDGDEGSTDQS
jgi:molecular chaperone GrpE